MLVAAGGEPVQAGVPELRIFSELRGFLLKSPFGFGPMHLKYQRGTCMRTARTGVVSAAAIAVALITGGCHSKSSATPENFIKGLNAHFAEHPDCLLPDAPHFPYETTDPEKTKQMNALVTAQLLKVSVEGAIHASRYVTTPAGDRLAPRFCYGHRVVTAIDKSTPPAPRNGFPETDVLYTYHMEDVPTWAQSQVVKDAFPKMAKQTSGDATDKATLAGTITGWQVPD
jgi:hypothetical protein